MENITSKNYSFKTKELSLLVDKIFGKEILKDAYFIFDVNSYEKFDEQFNIVKLWSVSNTSQKDEIGLDNLNIGIEFINGKKVVFNVSEWGDIKSFSDIEITRVE